MIGDLSIKNKMTDQLETLLQMEYVDMLELCIKDQALIQICCGDTLWQRMFIRDFPFYRGDRTRKNYEKVYYLFDDFTLRVVKKLIIYHTKKPKLEKAYQDVFDLLLNYFKQMIIGEDRNILDLKIFTGICQTLNVPFQFNETFYHLCKKDLVENTDENKWQFFKLVIDDMLLTYQ